MESAGLRTCAFPVRNWRRCCCHNQKNSSCHCQPGLEQKELHPTQDSQTPLNAMPWIYLRPSRALNAWHVFSWCNCTTWFEFVPTAFVCLLVGELVEHTAGTASWHWRLSWRWLLSEMHLCGYLIGSWVVELCAFPCQNGPHTSHQQEWTLFPFLVCFEQAPDIGVSLRLFFINCSRGGAKFALWRWVGRGLVGGGVRLTVP